jgi:hypothetical protein
MRCVVRHASLFFLSSRCVETVPVPTYSILANLLFCSLEVALWKIESYINSKKKESVRKRDKKICG